MDTLAYISTATPLGIGRLGVAAVDWELYADTARSQRLVLLGFGGLVGDCSG
ncbi:hypothetical protein [Amycolatopsis anabasis]|uniref:hypothetical protein n=1 Tax=Amycolatopsis anabasis TaxID=1840409 RepID=UPI00131EA1F6|nr:hypothetical protein [Amycolatopsis anabasis]